MSSSPRIVFSALLFPILLTTAPTAWGCSSCGCNLSPDWESQGLVNRPGFRLDFRYDYINQNQLRQGSGTAGAIALPAANETERKTTNNYYTVGLDYSPDQHWGVNLQLPYVDRSHTTVAPGDTSETSSHTRALGDIKLVGRYQGLFFGGPSGIMVGMKLPTGGYHDKFSSGPQADTALDRSLQAGTGSTDLILGAFRSGMINLQWDWFIQGMVQTAMATKEDYRPGNSYNLNVGLRYLEFFRKPELGSVVPQLQINAQSRQRDGGANGDPMNTGGQLVYLSPGLSVSLSQQTRLYGFVQLPLYQRVEGLQLAPRWNASVGVNYSF